MGWGPPETHRSSSFDSKENWAFASPLPAHVETFSSHPRNTGQLRLHLYASLVKNGRFLRRPWPFRADHEGATAMAAMMGLSLLAVLVGFYGALALADNVTFDVVNTTNNTIFPRVVGAGSSDPTMDFTAVPPKGSVRLYFKRDSHFALFFARGCSQDESGHLTECSSGNCPKEGCTSVDNPVATMIYYDNGTVTASGPFGYNFALRAEFLSADGKCPPVSCDIPLKKCPEGLRILEESSGLPVACKARDKVPYCQGGAATSCFDGAILMVTVS